MFMWGCHNESKALRAKQEINVYKDYNDDLKAVIFVLNPGDECEILGGERVAKVYAYYPVSCPGKGKGWVMLGGDYEVFLK